MFQNGGENVHGWNFHPRMRCGEAEAERAGSPVFDGRTCSGESKKLEADGQGR